MGMTAFYSPETLVYGFTKLTRQQAFCYPAFVLYTSPDLAKQPKKQ